MAIITISRGSYSYGKEIAEKVAQRLGYECIAREVLLKASKEFNIPEIQLLRAVKDGPSFLGRFSQKKEKYLAFILAAFFTELQKDNLVYHGLAGHLFAKNISHVLKVRIIADMEDRVRLVMDRDKISRDEAKDFIEKIDAERVNWCKYFYGIYKSDPRLYDLVIHVRKFTAEDAVDMVCRAAGLEQFQTTPESQKAMDDSALAARVKAGIVDVIPDAQVSSQDGIVFVNIKAHLLHEASLVEKIKRISETIPGVKETKINVFPKATGAH